MSVANSAQARAGFNRWMSKHSFPSNRWKLCLRRDLLPCACPNIKWIHILIHIVMLTWVVCKFRLPERMPWSVGYLIPNSQGNASFCCNLPTTGWFTVTSSAAASAASLSKEFRYCRCPALVCHFRMHPKTSLLLVHCANLLHKSMWQCSGPCPKRNFKSLQQPWA